MFGLLSLKGINSILISINLILFDGSHVRGSYDIVPEILNTKIKLGGKKRLCTLWILMIIFSYSVKNVALIFIEKLIESWWLYLNRECLNLPLIILNYFPYGNMRIYLSIEIDIVQFICHLKPFFDIGYMLVYCYVWTHFY